MQIDPNSLIDPTGVGWHEVIAAVAVMVVTVALASLTGRLIRRTTRKWVGDESGFVPFLSKLARWLVILVGSTFALLFLGVQIGPVFLIILIVGVVVFLSARPLLENFGAGVVLQTEAPFHVGDLVEITGHRGTVKDISGRTTIIDTFDGRRVRVPNNQVLGSSIVNLTERGGRRSQLTVGVEYGTDLDRAQRVIVEALAGIDGVLGDPGPEALVSEFADSSIVFTVRFWHQTIGDWMPLGDQVARTVDRTLRREGIVIALPQRVVWEAGPKTEPGGSSHSR
jgi:small conductance mechanosensitive channel